MRRGERCGPKNCLIRSRSSCKEQQIEHRLSQMFLGDTVSQGHFKRMRAAYAMPPLRSSRLCSLSASRSHPSAASRGGGKMLKDRKHPHPRPPLRQISLAVRNPLEAALNSPTAWACSLVRMTSSGCRVRLTSAPEAAPTWRLRS